MWNIESRDDCITGNMYACDFKKIREAVHKCRGKVTIQTKKGIAFSLFKYRNHYTFFAGIFLSLIIMNMLSMYIWNVSFTGNSFYTDEVINRFISNNNVRLGVTVKSVNCSELEDEIRKKFEYVTWVSVKKDGTNLVINIKESSPKINQIDKTDACDIIASVDGKVKSIITRSGTPMVSAGADVKKGDILVSGIVNINDDAGESVSKKYVTADSDIIIDYHENYTDSVSMNVTKEIETGRKIKHLIFKIGDSVFETGFKCKYQEYNKITNLNNIRLSDSFAIPVFFGTIIYSETKNETISYTKDEAEELLGKKYSAYINKLKGNNVQIVQDSVKINEDFNAYSIEAKIQAEAAMVQYVPVTDNNEQREELKE